MSLSVQLEAPPLRLDASGAYRIGDSRVLLELVIQAFDDGGTPESIVEQYPTTTLSDIYAVIAFYLQHRQDVAAYLREREIGANALQQKIESQQGNNVGEVRRRLRANLPQR
jgi:uncharacterized protein (DUF433 family)